MAVTYVTHATALNASLECTRPTGYDATYPAGGTWGPLDLVVFVGIWYDDAAAAMTAPSGFTQPGGNAKRVANHTNILVVELCWKIAGGSEPTTYNASGAAESQYNNSFVMILRGTDQTSPLDVASGNSGQSGTVTWTGVTPARAGSLALAIHGGYNNPSGTISGTPTMTERINALDGVNDASTASYGTSDTGNRTATVTSDTWAALFAIFQPPAPSTVTALPGVVGCGF